MPQNESAGRQAAVAEVAYDPHRHKALCLWLTYQSCRGAILLAREPLAGMSLAEAIGHMVHEHASGSRHVIVIGYYHHLDNTLITAVGTEYWAVTREQLTVQLGRKVKVTFGTSEPPHDLVYSVQVRWLQRRGGPVWLRGGPENVPDWFEIVPQLVGY